MDTVLHLLSIAATAFVVGLSGAMMPGPLLAVTVNEASKRGAVAGPLLMLGHMVLEAVLVTAVALGCAGFLNHPLTMALVGLLGGAVMCWMGAGMIRSARRVSLTAAPESRTGLHPVLAGILVSLSNPYWTIWWATIGMTYIMMGLHFGLPGIIAFFAGHISADFAWYSFVSFGTARGGQMMPDRVYRALIVACGVALIAFGLWFFRSGFRALAA